MYLQRHIGAAHDGFTSGDVAAVAAATAAAAAAIVVFVVGVAYTTDNNSGTFEFDIARSAAATCLCDFNVSVHRAIAAFLLPKQS